MSLLALDEASLENVALDLLRQAGWQTAFGPEIAPEELLAERTDYREVVLTGRLRSAVALLNPELPSDAVSQVVLTVLRAESQALEAENWRAYQLLVEGVPVTYRDEAGNNRHDKARLVDWDDVAANDLVAVNQFTVTGKSERRPDIVLFVNGLPLGLLELKKPGEVQATLRGAFNQIKTYRNQVPELFIWNQVTVISDGIQARAATYTALTARVSTRVAAWDDRVGRFDALLRAEFALPAGTADDERIAALRAAEVVVSTSLTTPEPSDPAAYRRP